MCSVNGLYRHRHTLTGRHRAPLRAAAPAPAAAVAAVWRHSPALHRPHDEPHCDQGRQEEWRNGDQLAHRAAAAGSARAGCAQHKGRPSKCAPAVQPPGSAWPSATPGHAAPATSVTTMVTHSSQEKAYMKAHRSVLLGAALVMMVRPALQGRQAGARARGGKHAGVGSACAASARAAAGRSAAPGCCPPGRQRRAPVGGPGEAHAFVQPVRVHPHAADRHVAAPVARGQAGNPAARWATTRRDGAAVGLGGGSAQQAKRGGCDAPAQRDGGCPPCTAQRGRPHMSS